MNTNPNMEGSAYFNVYYASSNNTMYFLASDTKYGNKPATFMFIVGD